MRKVARERGRTFAHLGFLLEGLLLPSPVGETLFEDSKGQGKGKSNSKGQGRSWPSCCAEVQGGMVDLFLDQKDSLPCARQAGTTGRPSP